MPKRRPKIIKNSVIDTARFTGPKATLPDLGQKVPKVRHSGHFVDQKLKYNGPTPVDMFEQLSPHTIGKVQEHALTCEGIRLTPSEDRLLTAIYNILRAKSETKNASSPKFYSGNHEVKKVMEYGEVPTALVHIRITPAELYKAYLGNSRYSGKEVSDINKLLERLEATRFLIKYDRIRKVRKGRGYENRTDRIEKVQSLIQVIKHTPDLTDKEVAKLDSGDESIRQKKGELIIALHPVLTDQINSKYVEYPQDISRRTAIAAGGQPKNVTTAINTLRDWLLREISNKRTKFEVNADKLPYLLKLDNYIKAGRKKLVQETIAKAIETCQALGLILDVTQGPGAEGQIKYVFLLNLDFE